MNQHDVRASLAAELLKLRRRPTVWALGGVWVAMGVFFGYLLPYLIHRSGGDVEGLGIPLDGMLPGSLVENVIQGFPLFGFAIAISLGALAMGSEYGWGTLTPILVQGPGRLSVLAGKLAGLAVVALLLTVLEFVAGAVSAVTIALIERTDVGGPSISQVARGLGAGWLILLTGVSLGAMLAWLLRGPGLAIGLGLVYVLIFEGALGGFADESSVVHAIASWLPGVNAGSLAGSFVTRLDKGAAPGVVDIVGPTRAAAVVALEAIVFLAVTAWLFVRRDITTET